MSTINNRQFKSKFIFFYWNSVKRSANNSDLTWMREKSSHLRHLKINLYWKRRWIVFAQSFNDIVNVTRVKSFTTVLLSRRKSCLILLESENKWNFHPSPSLTANYDPSEDEYARKNGHVMMNGGALENNNQPVTSQPTRMQRNISLNRYENLQRHRARHYCHFRERNLCFKHLFISW